MILIRISQGALAASLLERAGILVETYYLPSDAPTVPTGLRLATHIATRRGMGEPEMKELARAMAEVLLSGEHPEHVFHTRVRPLTEGLLRAAYSFDQYFPLADSWHEDPYAGFRLDSPIRILRGMPAFAGCSTTDLEEIAERLSVERFDDARGIFCAGDEADAVYFIDHGAANVLDITPSGTRHVNRLTDGHHFGELEVLLGRPRRFHVRVEPGTRLLGISAANFAAIVERLPTVQRYFKRYVELKWG